MMRANLTMLVWCTCLGAAGCAGGDEPAGPVGAGTVPEGVESDLEMNDGQDDTPYVQPGPWADMDRSERFEFMREVVVPEMGALFREHDAEKYADFGCGTCHGEDASDVEFAMPNGLAPLDTANFPLTESEDPEVAADAVFMEEVVAPAMVQLLDAEPWSPDNREGFGCFGCHAREEG